MPEGVKSMARSLQEVVARKRKQFHLAVARVERSEALVRRLREDLRVAHQYIGSYHDWESFLAFQKEKRKAAAPQPSEDA